MIKVTQVTVYADGTISTSGAELESLSEDGVRKHIGATTKYPMDAYVKNFVHGKPVISIALAQEAAWSYVTHIFVMA